MMTSIRADKSRRIFAALLCAVALVFASCFVGCGNGSGNGNGSGDDRLTAVSGTVRTVGFTPLAVDILYDGKKVGVSGDDGAFTVNIPHGDDIAQSAKLTVDGNAFTYLSYSNSKREFVIVRAETDATVDDFCCVSGKVVLHSDGETVAPGCELRIDGATVLHITTDRNFDIKFVHKDSVFSAYKQGGEFVDRNEIPYDRVTPADVFDDHDETTELTVNGQKRTVKVISPITFRLNDII